MSTKESIVNFDLRNESSDLIMNLNSDETNLLTDVDVENASQAKNAAQQKKETETFIVKNIITKPLYAFIKRFADIVLSLVVSVILLIPIAVISVVIMIKDPGNPFYIHTRLGKEHRPIRVMKLRTMRKDADRLENMLTPEQLEEYKREYKLCDDPRLIGWKQPGDGSRCFGAKLRRASIDEIMQIPYNILLKGNMSFVGPRPIMESELNENYTPEQQKILLSVKPGLTGYWQAYARNEAKYGDGERQRMEMYYVQNRSLLLDIKILFATAIAVVKKNGV